MIEIDPEGNEVRALFAAVDFAGKMVLEIGCGDGRLTFKYARTPQRVVGIEPGASLLTSAQADCPIALRPHVCFAQATAMTLPFRSDTFDVVLLAKSL
jgi:ubiquinone/menaquinone biosynthesis C-methylase UbiE